MGTALALSLLGWALIGMGVQSARKHEDPNGLVALYVPLVEVSPPPPPVTRPRPATDRRRASPPDLRNDATDIVAQPVPPLQLPSPVVVAPKAGEAMAPETGAAERAGPGDGAGGPGDGRGGDGDGDELAPRQIGGRLRISDLPADIRDAGIGGTVSVRYGVETDGRVVSCFVTSSSGNATIDMLTCRLIERRFRFAPSRDGKGRPVRSIIEENHRWIFEPATDRPHAR